MSLFTVTPEAKRDLEAIIEYIAAESPSAAVSVRDKLYDAFQKLGETPGAGHYREDLLDKRFRFQSVYSYLIIYKWNAVPIQIIAVIHGARDLARQFERRGIR